MEFYLFPNIDKLVTIFGIKFQNFHNEFNILKVNIKYK